MRTSLPPDIEPDPVFLNARREGIVGLWIWAVFALWVVGISGWLGYREPTPDPGLTLGLPTWVFWGVGLPWLAANLVSLWFALGFLTEDDLGEETPISEAGVTRKEADHE